MSTIFRKDKTEKNYNSLSTQYDAHVASLIGDEATPLLDSSLVSDLEILLFYGH